MAHLSISSVLRVHRLALKPTHLSILGLQTVISMVTFASRNLVSDVVLRWNMRRQWTW